MVGMRGLRIKKMEKRIENIPYEHIM